MTQCPASFAVVIPMYNEEAGAHRCIEAVCAELQRLPNRSRLIVVDDGSRDGTRRVLRSMEGSFAHLQVVCLDSNSGYGAALRAGVRRAHQEGLEYTLFMDSDLTNDPSDIGRFVEHMDRRTDVIKATRYSDGGGVSGVPYHRVVISRLGNILAGALLRMPLADCTNGFRAVKTVLLGQVELCENNFSVIMEELYRLKPLAKSYARVPVTLTSRCEDQRATSFRYRPSIFWDYLKYPLRCFLGL